MQRTLRFLVGLVTVGLFSLASISCSKDEMNEKNIVGKWQSTKFTYECYEAGKLVEEGSETCIDWYLGFNFKSDGTGQTILYDSGESDSYQMTWVIMGDKLVVTDEDGDTEAYNIVEIKSNSMILSVEGEDTYNGVMTKDVSIFYFNKI